MKLQAIKDKIIAKELSQTTTTDSGIIVADEGLGTKFPQRKMEVVSVGSDIDTDIIDVGTVIYTAPRSTRPVTVPPDEDYHVYTIDEIYCIVSD